MTESAAPRRHREPGEQPARAHHDMGGVAKFLCEPIDTGAHALTAFDREVDAIRGLLGAKGVMSVDELRRGIEAIPEAEYHALSYYQRWIRSIADNLMARGVITPAELAAPRLGGVSGRFAPGAAVLVRDDWPEARGPVHIRTPALPARPPRHRRAPPGRLRQPGGPGVRPAGRPPAAVSRRVRGRRDLARTARQRPSFSWRCSSHGCSRPDPVARGERPAAAGGARPAGGQGRADPGGHRRAHPQHRPGQPGAGRPHGGPRLDRPGVSRADAAGRHRGRGAGSASRCAACPRWACWPTRPGCTTWWYARCAAATRAPCSAIRRSGSSRPATAPVPCATRRACWPNGGPSCRRAPPIRVVDSTADYRWMVLPLRPAGTEGWPEDRLAALVSEGDMIGVTVPRA